MTTSRKPFNCFECILLIFSIATYLLDISTDILLAVYYYHDGQVVWGSLTIGIVVLSSIAIQVFSGRWYVADGQAQNIGCWLVHLLQFQPLERYVQVLVAGVKVRRHTTAERVELYYYQQNDVSMLRLFQTFLQSAPQLTLQVYIVFCTDATHWLAGVSACISLVSIGWSVAAYSHALRQAYQDEYSVHTPGLLVLTVWHVAIATSRVIAIVAFASVFKYWVFLAIGIHWICMTIWVMLQEPDFCPSKVEEKLFDCVVAIIYCFTFFNLKDGKTRWRILFFCILMAVENGAATALWYVYHEPANWFDPIVLAAEIASFMFGICCMMLYYRFCHPSGPISCCCVPEQEPQKLYQSTPNFNRSSSIRHSKNLKNISGPQCTSTVQLPRRTLLKPQPSKSKMVVEYKEVYTPSQLSPIKSPPTRHTPNHTETSWQFNDTGGFHHYSVDATAGLVPTSRVATLQGKGIDLSADDCMLFRSRRQLYSEDNDLQDMSGAGLSMDKLDTNDRRYSFTDDRATTQDSDSAVYEPSNSRYVTGNHDDFAAVEECPRCNKPLKYMDQTVYSMGDSMADYTVAYCHCTLAEDNFLFGGATERQAKLAVHDHSIVSESSGFHSHSGTDQQHSVNYKDVHPNKPQRFKFLP